MMKKAMILAGMSTLVIFVVIVVVIINLEEETPEIIDTTQISGPFQINKSKYKLGEKIFFTVEELQKGEKGKAIFLRPLNATHMTAYNTIPFDGKLKTEFNQYVEPKLLKSMKTCSMEDIIGEWKIKFDGTNYQSLKFQISDEIITGEEDRFQPVC